MTSFRIERFDFTGSELRQWADTDPRHHNWPVVYALNADGTSSEAREIYVGESLNAMSRLAQHLTTEKRRLTSASVIVDDEFNKSACLDLESRLIRLFAGDGKYQVLNRNDGITEADYYDRQRYQAKFDEIFRELLDSGLFTQDRTSIENSDLFKLSPFKALTDEQAGAVANVLDGLFDDLEQDRTSTTVLQGEPGTGKTVIAIYLMKLLEDIRTTDPAEAMEFETQFDDYFMHGFAELLDGFRVGIVVPQQSLRKSVERVFQKTPGLAPAMVLTPFQVGESEGSYDLLIVDEAHRLNQRSNQPSGVQNKRFRDITTRIFGVDDRSKTQLDWIIAKSRRQILLIDPEQSVRPGDLPRATLDSLVGVAKSSGRYHQLWSQLRVRGGDDYVKWAKSLLSGRPEEARSFPDYDLRFFTDLGEMRTAILERERETGLARLVAGYAWEWKSKNDKHAVDIEIDGIELQWNRTATDWVNSNGSINEVGSIHTIQGYDLNYAGVIIGKDVRYDPVERRVHFDRANYFDKKGVENNKQLGITYSDEDVLRYVRNVYSVLLTRGIRGTYVYICDPALREHLRSAFP
ncbi:DNA/RNA helicase domain-containing protein [Actinospongicola halichondriae]|uniref:DNA/RNA helicase domain-containing protein n=1 Tax=Actinospongicola halichondriae TaxID=3236844 RepID=UPI003D575986